LSGLDGVAVKLVLDCRPVSTASFAHLGDIEELEDGRCPWRPIRLHFGITSFGINAWTARNAGDRIINEHDESGADQAEELYLVFEGRASFELDGEQRDAPAGTLVFVPAGVKRTAFAEQAGTTIFAIGGVPGKPYEATGWEVFAPVTPLYEAGKYDEASDRGRELLANDPPFPALFYNVACCESLAGRTDDAIEHLHRAFAGSESLRELAKTDSDFDPIRDEPGFKELLAE
jgi:hypothetical protein